MSEEQLGEFKGQPWIVYDTVASRSFLVGESRAGFEAIGTSGPAISRAGELVFFSAGRTKAQQPWYTNMDLNGQLSYGFRVWGAYLIFNFPSTAPEFNDQPESGVFQPSYGSVLAQAIIDYGVLSLLLGQEEQMDFPCARFGAGGGLSVGPEFGTVTVQNSIPDGANVMKFPEAIDMARTLNVSAKIRIAPEVLPTIGTQTVPGVGADLATGAYGINIVDVDGADETVALDFPPYAVQCGLIGERIKKTQYGQLPGGA